MKSGSPEPRFIPIRCFAVRDSIGQFQGTIEGTQDMTEIRKLEGSADC
jgi:DUF438 domain-containing protein